MFDIKTRDGSVNVAVGKSVDVHVSWNNPMKYGQFGLTAEWGEYDITAACGLGCVYARITVILRPFDVSLDSGLPLDPSDAPNAQEAASEGKSE